MISELQNLPEPEPRNTGNQDSGADRESKRARPATAYCTVGTALTFFMRHEGLEG